MRGLGYDHPVDEVQVETTRLDELVKEFQGFRPFFVKIDVGGSELSVLQSASCSTMKPCRSASSSSAMRLDLSAFTSMI